MEINDARDLKTLGGIEDELSKIESSYLGGAPLDRASSGALLFRQAELLVEKSKLFLAHHDDATGQDSAMQALGILKGIAAIDGAEFQAKMVELSSRATACLGLAQCERGDWFAARHTLGKLTAEATQKRATQALEVVELESRVAAENAERRRIFERIVAEQEQVRAPLAPHWEAAEVKLDRLVKEIAERIAQAKSVLAGVPYPDRFETWLLERIGYFVNAIPLTSDSPEPESRDKQFIGEAAEQGRQLQLLTWSSKEMYYAENFGPNGNEVVTDEALMSSREHGLLGLPHPDDSSRFAYPKWQFNSGQRENVRKLLLSLRTIPEWARWNYFHMTSPVLRGLTPLQVLGLGDEKYSASDDLRIAAMVKEFGSAEAAVVAATNAYLSGDE